MTLKEYVLFQAKQGFIKLMNGSSKAMIVIDKYENAIILMNQVVDTDINKYIIDNYKDIVVDHGDKDISDLAEYKDYLSEILSNELSEESKIKEFQWQLNWISDSELKSEIGYIISKLPNKFFTAPASSSGLHHPVETRGYKGLVIHTKYAFNALLELLEASDLINENWNHDCDLMCAAILLHDGFKYGIKGELDHTTYNHPELMADYLLNYSNRDCDSTQLHCLMKDIESISMLVRTHHGIWGNQQPKTLSQNLVHLADYISSGIHRITNLEDR